MVQAQYDDVRCKCVCPVVTKTNTTLQSRKVYVRSFHEPSMWYVLNSLTFTFTFTFRVDYVLCCGPMCNPDITEGYVNVFQLFMNLKECITFTE